MKLFDDDSAFKVSDQQPKICETMCCSTHRTHSNGRLELEEAILSSSFFFQFLALVAVLWAKR